MATYEEDRQLNQTIFDWLDGDEAQRKVAADGLEAYVRLRIREESFAEELLPSRPISYSELTPQLWTDKPVKVLSKEPDCPPAKSIPYGNLPDNYYFHGPKYAVTFERIATQRANKDMAEIGTYDYDIRQVISDNMVKEIHVEQDAKFISAVEMALIAAGSNTPASQYPQWQNVVGGITRSSILDSLKIMPSTFYSLSAETILVNEITVLDVMKWTRDDAGGDIAEKWLLKGWAQTNLLDRKWIVTIKKGLVPNNRMYHFASPKYIGRMLVLEDVTMHMKREFWQLQWFASKHLGGSIAHTGGLAIANFI